MKVEVEKITEGEFILTEDIPAKSWDMDSFDVRFVNDIHLKCSFRKLGREIFVDCRVITPIDITCSRCLGNVRQTKEQKIQLSYSIAKLGQYLEVDKEVREEILLNFPMKVLCSPDCKGICPGCGVNLNLDKCKCKKKQSRTRR